MQSDGCETCRLGRYSSDFNYTGMSRGTNQSRSRHVLSQATNSELSITSRKKRRQIQRRELDAADAADTPDTPSVREEREREGERELCSVFRFFFLQFRSKLVSVLGTMVWKLWVSRILGTNAVAKQQRLDYSVEKEEGWQQVQGLDGC